MTPQKKGDKFKHLNNEFTADYFTAVYNPAKSESYGLYETISDCKEDHPNAVFYGVVNKEYGGFTKLSDCLLIKK